MVSDWLDLLFIFGIGLLSGSLNSVAGGGSFFSLPVLLSVGLPPVVAQVTNHLGLLPANAMALLPFFGRIWSLRYRLLSIIFWCVGSGICGGLALILFPPSIFEGIVPFLVLGAVVLYSLEPRLKILLSRISDNNASHSLILVRSFQILVSFYCGYFGAGVGFLFLLAFALDGFDEMIDMQCMKNVVVSIIGIFVLVVFILGGSISWLAGLVLFVGSAIGGFCGGRIISYLPHHLLRFIIICVGVGLFFGYLIFY